MALSNIDKGNISKLFNITELILDTYNEMAALEIAHNDIELNKKIMYLSTISDIEQNTISEFNDINKYQDIIDFISSQSDEQDPIVIRRITTKLNEIFVNYQFNRLQNKTKLSLEESIQKGNILTSQVNSFISNDINNIFLGYLNNHIESISNEDLKNYLIEYKYINIFYNIKDDLDISKLVHNNENGQNTNQKKLKKLKI